MTNQDDRLFKDIRERLKKATPGQWSIRGTSDYLIETENEILGSLGGHSNLVNNGELIANAPTDIARLLKAVDLLVKAVSGEHEGCNYLAYGMCNKCGSNVNGAALTKLKELEKKP